jgi:hypothetical protein
MSRDLPLYGMHDDVEVASRLHAELRGIDREEAAFQKLHGMSPAVRQCFGGTRNFLRAIAAGHVELTPDLRAELVEVVREISEIVMAHDLEGKDGE